MSTFNSNKFRVRNTALAGLVGFLAVSSAIAQQDTQAGGAIGAGVARAAGAAVGDSVPATPALAASAPADPATIALRQALMERYPNTKFGQISRTPMAGVWEVWMGSNVAYVTDDARYFLFGHLFDMQTQTDLTAPKKGRGVAGDGTPQTAEQQPKLSFSDLPLDMAIKVVRGNGSRKIAVFSDPDCSYCQRLEQNLTKLKDVTIYTFLYPIESLHPDAASKAERIWCSKDRAGAWTTFMTSGKLPSKAPRCKTPLDSIAEIGQRGAINGTPYIFFENGSRAAGALDAAALELRLSSN